ncbi:hypothetical protein V8G54_025618 [Vigna mungo]|uniref:Uncharacterized protein n=1 Tax=Vigna mungo TaxID=3915 RepID=A0AAQ3MYN0_VIGMU
MARRENFVAIIWGCDELARWVHVWSVQQVRKLVGARAVEIAMDVDELDCEGILERNRYPEGGSEEDIVGAPDEGGLVGDKGLAWFGTAVDNGDREKPTVGDDAVTGDCGAVVNRTGTELKKVPEHLVQFNDRSQIVAIFTKIGYN